MQGGRDEYELSLHERRLYAMEKDVQQLQRTSDVTLQRTKTLEERMDSIEAKLNRIMWGVFAAAFGLLGQLLLQYLNFLGAHTR